MKTIKNILVPTDFSVTARNAFHYAKTLAESLGANITVVHISEYFIPVSDIAVVPLSKAEEGQLQESMETFISEEIGISDTAVLVKNNVKTLIQKGNPVDRLVDLSRQYDLIVMGTTGLQDFITKIIGSVSLDVAHRAHCPVILVPRDTQWKRIDTIMYASNYDSTTPKMVREITDLAQLVGAAVHFVHVEEFSENDDHVTEIIWDELFAGSDPSLSFEIHTITGDDKIAELRHYAENNAINLMAFVSKHRSFWQNLIHRSVTQNIAISTSTPMLVMHFDDAQ